MCKALFEQLEVWLSLLSVEGQLPSGIYKYLSLISSFSFIAHAQVKLWKANYLDNWTIVQLSIPHFLDFIYCSMRRYGRQTIWTTGQCLSVYLSLPAFHLLLHAQLKLWRQTIWTTGQGLTVYFSLPTFHLLRHAQVKLWKANCLANWKCVYPSPLQFHLQRMRR